MGGIVSSATSARENQFAIKMDAPNAMRWKGRAQIEVEATTINLIRRNPRRRSISSVNLRYCDLRRIDLQNMHIQITPAHGKVLGATLEGGVDEMCEFKNCLLRNTNHGQLVEIFSH